MKGVLVNNVKDARRKERQTSRLFKCGSRAYKDNQTDEMWAEIAAEVGVGHSGKCSCFVHLFCNAKNVVRPSACSSLVHTSQSEAVVYLENGSTRITKFYMNIHTGLLYVHPGYGITNYFRSEIIAKITVENAASDGFWWNFLITV